MHMKYLCIWLTILQLLHFKGALLFLNESVLWTNHEINIRDVYVYEGMMSNQNFIANMLQRVNETQGKLDWCGLQVIGMNETLQTQKQMIQELDQRLAALEVTCFSKGLFEKPCSGHGDCITMDVCVCDDDWFGLECSENFQWHHFEEGDLSWPISSERHSAVVYQDEMFIFSGLPIPCDKFWKFNFTSRLWNEMDFSLVNFARYSHSSNVYLDAMWIFGGSDVVNTFRNDMVVYNFTNDSWEFLDLQDPKPQSRSWHSSVVHNQGMWVFGGYQGSVFADFWRFDFPGLDWEQLGVSGGPNQLYSHSAVVGHDAMWLFGGYNQTHYMNDVWRFAFGGSLWTKFSSNGESWPDARNTHSAAVDMNAMYIYGGFDSGHFFNDLWRFEFDSQTWKLIGHFDQLNRREHSAVVYQQEMWIFGGIKNGVLRNDLVQMILSWM